MKFCKATEALALVLMISVYFSSTKQVSGNEIDIRAFVESGFTIRCAQEIEKGYLGQIEIVYSGAFASNQNPLLVVDVFQTVSDRPDRREDDSRSFYSWGEGADEANVAIDTFGSAAGGFHIIIEVDNSNDTQLYQLAGVNKESYVTNGQWKFTNLANLQLLDEPILVQESVSFYKGKISNTVNKRWQRCTMLGSDGLFSNLEMYLKSQE